jgi:ribosomal protein L11 methyltransferase
MNYIKISIPVHTQEQSDICLSQLNELGFEGFEEKENLLEAFIPENKFDEQKLVERISAYSDTFTKYLIEQKNWNEEWEKNFLPVMIGDFCAIRASFHHPIPSVRNEIIITPKMSFGTGHHPSTYLMIKAMSKIDFVGKSVFDFGTGTGVLSILAEKMGAGAIFATDIDDWSIENALENISVNKSRNIEIEKTGDIPTRRKFDIILANINKNVIINRLDQIRQQLTLRGVLLICGLLELDSEECIQRFSESGFGVAVQLFKEGWTCFELRKTNL